MLKGDIGSSKIFAVSRNNAEYKKMMCGPRKAECLLKPKKMIGAILLREWRMKEDTNFLQVIINLLDSEAWQQSFNHSEPQPARLRLKLRKAGIEKNQIAQAIAWFTHLHTSIYSFDHGNLQSDNQRNRVRIYDASEQKLLSSEGIEFLSHLENLHIIDFKSREIILDMLFTLEAFEVDPPLIKWVALIVLYALPNHQEQLLSLELLVLETPDNRVH
jgi:uncharacterized protein Smg (DUF494 family)